MKVSIKLTTDQIIYLAGKMLKVQERLQDFNALNQRQRAGYSILADVYDVVYKKSRALQRKNDLFDAKKKHTVGMKYHEASELLDFMNNFTEADDYKKTCLGGIIGILDQKLA